MRAITLQPGVKDSAALEEVPEPPAASGAVLVDGVALGICGTDAEIVQRRLRRGATGRGAPRARPRVARPREPRRPRAAASRPATSSSASCAARTRCRARRAPPASGTSAATARFTERGIKALHGYGSERWRIEPEFAVKLDPALGVLGVLMEPTTVVAKAWEQIDRVLTRATLGPERVLVTGAGPIGLLARAARAQARLRADGARPRDRRPEARAGARRSAARYHTGSVADVDPPPDIIVEATGRQPGACSTR